jgi:hypothetical protein
MSDWPNASEPLPTHISSFMGGYFPTSEGRWVAFVVSNPVSGAWPTANLAINIPFSLPHPMPVRRLFWANGSAAGGEWNAGILTAGYELLGATGKVAGSGNTAIQYGSVTEMLLNPGSYIFSLAHSATTANQANSMAITAIQGRIAGMTQQASSLELPTSGTPAKYEGLIYPLCGLTRTASGF